MVHYFVTEQDWNTQDFAALLGTILLKAGALQLYFGTLKNEVCYRTVYLN